jgi:hypothetical protein
LLKSHPPIYLTIPECKSCHNLWPSSFANYQPNSPRC